MQFQVPQFTEVEDKIFGPLTLKQFVYVAGGAGLSFLLWRMLPGILAIPIGLAIVGGAGALAFIQVNKKPLIITVEAAFMYFIHTKLYLWNANFRDKQKEVTTPTETPIPQGGALSLSDNKLKDLAWSLDINEKLNFDKAVESQK